jgi:hypothetical protein
MFFFKERHTSGEMTLRAGLLGAVCAVALAQPVLADAALTENIVVTGRAGDWTRIASSSNEGSISAADMGLRPLLRPGEIVENIPGVIVTQHSGSGKANQYFLRGFNLDHGTDLAISLDGVPVNMVSHAHGQGYADLNFVIPELIEAVSYKKGPYYADVGDFGAAGAFNIRYYDTLPAGIARLEAGQYNYQRGVMADSAALGSGHLIYALELEHYDGPWDLAGDERKISGVLRYTMGGWAVTAMAYHNIWDSTDQVPVRAIDSGLISRWGAINPSDGGKTGRYSLSAAWNRDSGDSSSHLLFYGLYYDLDLKSDFTFFLNDPVHGDQFEQQDARWQFGAKASQNWAHQLFSADSATTIGLDLRNDDIRNGLFHTERRVRLDTTTFARTNETSLSPYIQNVTHWTEWLRTIAGARADFFWFDTATVAGNSGTGQVFADQFSPKIGIALGPWAKSELYANFGYGFHSNDARGVVDRNDPATPLTRAVGAETGIRTSIIPNLQTSLTAWLLNIQSELTWVGDEGTTEPGGRTRRYGIEFANFYTPTPWLTLDFDYAWSHSRFIDFDPAGQHIPEALVTTIDGGIALHDLGGWAKHLFGGLRLRYFGPRTLTRDNLVRSKATTLLYADLGYKLTPDMAVTLNVFNLLDEKSSDIDYFYRSRLPGEPASGVDDVHTHPSEPRQVRISLTMTL